mmetsp:Transcript_28224/g.64117  ORF Transcript_28224/g.64117 Transcript_28224/m.64117 type:complete len:312 (-) Transcript_28224:195-1130(-)
MQPSTCTCAAMPFFFMALITASTTPLPSLRALRVIDSCRMAPTAAHAVSGYPSASRTAATISDKAEQRIRAAWPSERMQMFHRAAQAQRWTSRIVRCRRMAAQISTTALASIAASFPLASVVRLESAIHAATCTSPRAGCRRIATQASATSPPFSAAIRPSGHVATLASAIQTTCTIVALSPYRVSAVLRSASISVTGGRARMLDRLAKALHAMCWRSGEVNFFMAAEMRRWALPCTSCVNITSGRATILANTWHAALWNSSSSGLVFIAWQTVCTMLPYMGWPAILSGAVSARLSQWVMFANAHIAEACN